MGLGHGGSGAKEGKNCFNNGFYCRLRRKHVTLYFSLKMLKMVKRLLSSIELVRSEKSQYLLLQTALWLNLEC